jgi:hypothetical protein
MGRVWAYGIDRGTYTISDNDDDHDTLHTERAAHKNGVHVVHGQRGAPGDESPMVVITRKLSIVSDNFTIRLR